MRNLADDGPARAGWDTVGMLSCDDGAIGRHLDAIFCHPAGDRRRRADLRPADSMSRSIAFVVLAGPTMLALFFDRLGVRVSGNQLLDPDGRFPREPEPIPETLGDLAELVQRSGADLGMAVDPDVDRLALVDETGRPIGEVYTLAVAARAVLARTPAQPQPVVVANLSTSLVVADAVRQSGGRFVRAPVGEANVARTIVAERAVLGGEGNGGVILPALHVGRDAPLGAALILQHLAASGDRLSAVVAASPRYVIVKAKAPRGGDLAAQYRRLEAVFPDAERDLRDGLRLGWPDRWLHVRPSGTEPIVRLIAEAPTEGEAQELVAKARTAGK